MTNLSVRQRQVLVGLADGMTNREIAEQLGISMKTVETHRARLYVSMGCNSRAGLIREGRQRGWLST